MTTEIIIAPPATPDDEPDPEAAPPGCLCISCADGRAAREAEAGLVTPAVAKLLWHEALDEWSEHEMLHCVPCQEGSCLVQLWLAAKEQAAWLAWLEARRLSGEGV